MDHDRDFHHHDRHNHKPDLASRSEGEARARPGLGTHISFDSPGSHPTSLSDIIDGLPTAVKSSLGPLRIIRRSARIRSWVSYFYEISASSMGAELSHQEHAGQHRQTLVSTTSTTTTTDVEMEEQHQLLMNSNQKRPRNSSTAAHTRNSKDLPASHELVEYVEQGRKDIDRFCGIQGKPSSTPES